MRDALDDDNGLGFYLDVANLGRWNYSIEDAALTCDARCAAFLGINETTIGFENLVDCVDSKE